MNTEYMKIIYGVIIGCILGVSIGMISPAYIKKFIKYKKDKGGFSTMHEFPDKGKWISAIVLSILFSIAFCFKPWYQAIFVCIFIFIAVAGSLIDYCIRIVANEMVLFTLALGIIYRVLFLRQEGIFSPFLGLGLIILLFGGTALILKLFGQPNGVGAGDVKLSMVVAIIAGYPGTVFFIGGLAVAAAIYCVIMLFVFRYKLTDTFPMCAFIMVGFMIELFLPEILMAINSMNLMDII